MWVFIDSHMSTLTLIKVYIWTYYSDILFCSVLTIKPLIGFIHKAPPLMSVSLITPFHFDTFEPVERYGSFRVFASKPTLTERSLKLGCHLSSVPIRKKLNLMYTHFKQKKQLHLPNSVQLNSISVLFYKNTWEEPEDLTLSHLQKKKRKKIQRNTKMFHFSWTAHDAYYSSFTVKLCVDKIWLWVTDAKRKER